MSDDPPFHFSSGHEVAPMGAIDGNGSAMALLIRNAERIISHAEHIARIEQALEDHERLLRQIGEKITSLTETAIRSRAERWVIATIAAMLGWLVGNLSDLFNILFRIRH